MKSHLDDAMALAQTTLEVLVESELPTDQWRKVNEQLHALRHALSSGDVNAFLRVVSNIRYIHAYRIGKIGDPSLSQSVPEPTREFINVLLDEIYSIQSSNLSREEQDDDRKTSKRRKKTSAGGL